MENVISEMTRETKEHVNAEEQVKGEERVETDPQKIDIKTVYQDIRDLEVMCSKESIQNNDTAQNGTDEVGDDHHNNNGNDDDDDENNDDKACSSTNMRKYKLHDSGEDFV